MFVTVIVCPSVTERAVGENPKSTIVRSAPPPPSAGLSLGLSVATAAVLSRRCVVVPAAGCGEQREREQGAQQAHPPSMHRPSACGPICGPSLGHLWPSHQMTPGLRARTVLRVGPRTGFASGTRRPRLPPWPSRRRSGATSTTRWCSRVCVPAARPASWPVRSTCSATRTTSPCSSSRRGRTGAATATRDATSAPVPAPVPGVGVGDRRAVLRAGPQARGGHRAVSRDLPRQGDRAGCASCTDRTAAPSRRCCSGACATARSTEP